MKGARWDREPGVWLYRLSCLHLITLPLSTQPTARDESIRTHRCQVQQQSQLVDEGVEEGEGGEEGEESS